MPKPALTPVVWAPSPLYTTPPFIGQPNKAPVAGAIAVDGHRPGAANPTPSEMMNEWQFIESTWTVWLSDGTFNAQADAHVVETDASGRTELIGIDLTDVVDRTIGTWVASNTLAPAINLTTGGGTGIQVNMGGGGGAAFSADLSPAGGGLGFTAVDSIASSGTAISAFMQGSGGLGTMFCIGSTPGLNIVTDDADALVLQAVGDAAALRLEPQIAPVSTVPGQAWVDTIDNYAKFVDPVGNTRRVWATREGIDVNSVEVAIAGNAPIAAATIVAYPFVPGRRYLITYGFSLSRSAGATVNGIDYTNVGGLQVPTWYGQPVSLVGPGGAALWEAHYTKTWLFTPVFPGPLNIQVFVGLSPGSGTLSVQAAYVAVLGVFD